MIDFHRLVPKQKEEYEQILRSVSERSCEYSFVNLYCWGLQKIAEVAGCIVFFSHFGGRSLYPYPIGSGDRKAAVEAILQDARERGIPARIIGMTAADREELETWFPGAFEIQPNRDGFDYVYDINDLADLKGRKFQKKRNHVNRFLVEHPDFRVEPLDASNVTAVREMVAQWYLVRKGADPQGDYLLESVAINRCLRHYETLGVEGLVLLEGERVLAVTLGSWLNRDTFDIHFEKAAEDADGAYAMINKSFARYLREKYPQLCYLDREDDMGMEGLRKAKLSYQPHHMLEKYWAYLRSDCFYGEELE